MGFSKCKIKKGMKGSHHGHSRWDGTEALKMSSKKARRTEGKNEIQESLK